MVHIKSSVASSFFWRNFHTKMQSEEDFFQEEAEELDFLQDVVGEVELPFLRKRWKPPENILLTNCFQKNLTQDSVMENNEAENYSGNEDEHDIYGDLESAVFSSTQRTKRSSLPRVELEEALQRAKQEIAELTERVTELSKENRNLVNNFSTLLKTAKDDKKKNIATLTELRNQLQHVTAVNSRGGSLTKAEVKKLNEYCSTVVEESIQSDVTYDIVKKAIENSKALALERQKTHLKRPWSKQIKFDNMSLYLSREQIPFQRLEPVKFCGILDQSSSKQKPSS